MKINKLNTFFNLDWTDDFINIIGELLRKNYESGEEDEDDDLDDLLSDCDDIDEKSNISVSKEEDVIEDYYNMLSNDISLSWKGFSSYLTYIVRFIKNIKDTSKINKFNYKIHTEFVNIIKEQRDHMIKLTESSKIWGYRDNDYNFIKS